jgi:hypothetical protein
MISKVVSPLKQNMYELYKCYMALKDHLLVMYDTQSIIILGDALIFGNKIN